MKRWLFVLIGFLLLLFIEIGGVMYLSFSHRLVSLVSSYQNRFDFYVGRFSNYKPLDANVKIDSTTLPVFYIETNKRIRKDNYQFAEVKLIDNGSCLYDGHMKIRYRGHASYRTAAKKSYALRPVMLSDSIQGEWVEFNCSLLGLKKGKKYALSAQYIDRSMIREAISFELAKHYSKGVPGVSFCEMVLNGKYYGIYALVEQPTRKRLNIKKTEDDVTGSYILYFSRPDEADLTIPVRFGENETRYSFQVKYPDIEKIDNIRKDWLKNRFQQMVDAICDSTTSNYRNYIDELSFIDFQLANEFAHNTDAYFCSGYLYKDKDSRDSTFKLHLWDNDHTFGMGVKKGFSYYDSWVYSTHAENGNYADWICHLMDNPYYRERLKERWKEYRSGAYSDENIELVVDSLCDMLVNSGAIERNTKAWKIWDNNGSVTTPIHSKYISDSYDDEIRYIKDWITRRLEWMDDQLLEIPNE